jgi:Domain of unknown function (DUF4303)
MAERAGSHALRLALFDILRREIAEGTRRTFAAVRSDCASERLYAFALYSDDGAMAICPAANTEETVRRRHEQSGATDPAAGFQGNKLKIADYELI